MTASHAPLTTPDGRYLVVRGRLWRTANPHLSAQVRARLVAELMEARRAVKAALAAKNAAQLATARGAVNAAKVALGERGPVWWTDGAKDLNRHLVKNTPYAAWFAEHAPTP
ncbi:hypothetical protein ACI6Q5_16885 [Xanthomonas codiaei]|uniref:Uncharacterized protein n=1 Tax=Xanthomonas codiaei TaxID=56463 RepID=A0A2S7CKA7_9XANT|nr:hypothetical protein [Xanthomonas codiaei]PPU62015.1 hypothetical protein XcodCFBP4690_14915 [Xanthomonas codiaei]